MTTLELNEGSLAVLRVISALVDRHEVVTVQAAAIGARMTYMDAYTTVNHLFSDGLLSHDLKVTEAGHKLI